MAERHCISSLIIWDSPGHLSHADWVNRVRVEAVNLKLGDIDFGAALSYMRFGSKPHRSAREISESQSLLNP